MKNLHASQMPTHHSFIDLTGIVYGRLTVTAFSKREKERTLWWCQCECGAICERLSGSLRGGDVRSCGCLKKELISQRQTTHGLSKTNGAYVSWRGMKRRCYNPNDPSYKNYGARGITVCERWLHSFENFFADMGERPAGLTLERKNNDSNYSPDNCEYATRAEQNRNKRKPGRQYTYA